MRKTRRLARCNESTRTEAGACEIGSGGPGRGKTCAGRGSGKRLYLSYPDATAKGARTSNRTSEFAADSAAITAAIEDHLLPKPSLDFERFPGVAEPKTKLFSGKATRSLSGPSA